MRLGLKIEAGFEELPAVRRLFAERDPLEELRRLGVEAVEVPLEAGVSLDEVAEQARRCQRVGMTVSFHPYTVGEPGNPAWYEGPESVPTVIHARFFTAAAAALGDQSEVIVNLHPAAASGLPRTVMLQRSIAFFGWANTWCHENVKGIRPVAELQVGPDPSEDLVRVGDTPEELQAVVKGSGVDACWDVGHAVFNHRRLGVEPSPAPDLWEHIAHVHCHDVGETDHLPPRKGDAPWRSFLAEAKRRGFAGTVVVEVTPETFLAHGGIDALTETLEAVAAEI